MAAAFVIRNSLLACIPLFLMLTGYLCSQKKVSAAYFKGILPLLTTYVLVCVMLLLRRVLLHHREMTLWEAIIRILAIDDGPIEYAWYVEMYIGLYLLIPFLNLIYHNLATRKEKQILLAVFLFLTMAPLCFNDIDWLTPGFLKQLNLSRKSQDILPDWWKRLWPLTYYFLGACLREYDIKIPKWKNLTLLAGSVLLFGMLDFYRSWGGEFRELGSSQSGSLMNTVNGVLLFLLLLHVDLSRVPGRVIALLKWISTLSFGIYLCSALTDELVYQWFNRLPISFTVKYLCMPLVVLASFSMATVLSQIIAWIQALLFRMAGQLQKLGRKKVSP